MVNFSLILFEANPQLGISVLKLNICNTGLGDKTRKDSNWKI
jgi:hypothetical protein